MKRFYSVLLIFTFTAVMFAGDGHNLWLSNKNSARVSVVCKDKSITSAIAAQELKDGWQGPDGATVVLKIKKDPSLVNDGFRLGTGIIQANSPVGLLYGVFELLRRQQTGETVENKIFNPSYQVRVLNHWDNLDGTIERGYAGRSLFWGKDKNLSVPTEEDKNRWKEYARANASIGINGAVLNNVNASPEMLSQAILKRAGEIAATLRPYGIKIYLSVKFSSPVLTGGLKTSDPLHPAVIQWWNEKVKEIYKLIPDFGGFLVKASSEGQPGPQDFGRTHADGANMLAAALKPYGGIVMWRAFVYSPNDRDRAKQAYNEFMPLDGQFSDNVIIQVKNGPVDFQPREPFSPLFGAMKHTSVMPEVQITQEYLGQSVHLVFLAPMWEEMFNSDTYQQGRGSTVAKCTDGSIYQQKYTAIAGVSNIGLDANWCGHDFATANWYAFGRQAWDHQITSAQIADEWLKLTFGDASVVRNADWINNFLVPVKQMMLDSREAAVNYMMPLGLHHLFSAEEHYGPGPWWSPKGVRADWTPPYYHQASANGIGFNRTRNGSNAVEQYHEPLASMFNDPATCPENLLLWFHHLHWDYKMKNGRILWDELCFHYATGLNQVNEFRKTWDKVEKYVDKDGFNRVQEKLREQQQNAQIWNDACLLYFRQFSKMPIPYELDRPRNNLKQLIENDLKRFETLK